MGINCRPTPSHFKRGKKLHDGFTRYKHLSIYCEETKIKKTRYAGIVATTALTLILTTQAQADSSNMMDNKILQELKTMIEQQQAQINK